MRKLLLLREEHPPAHLLNGRMIVGEEGGAFWRNEIDYCGCGFAGKFSQRLVTNQMFQALSDLCHRFRSRKGEHDMVPVSP